MRGRFPLQRRDHASTFAHLAQIKCKEKSLNEYANACRDGGAQRISKASSNAQRPDNTIDFLQPDRLTPLYTMARALLDFSRRVLSFGARTS
jgi:hypothetical protein